MVDSMTQSRGLQSFADIVRGLLGYRVAGPVDFLALYPGKVVSQSADKTRVDVQLDRTEIPSPSNIPLRMGIPGTTVTLNLSQTVRVLVGWEGGDPAKPFALLFDTGIGTTRIDIDATTIDLNNGTKGAARKDDTLTASTAANLWASQMESGLAGVGGTVPIPAWSVAAGVSGGLGDIESCSASVKVG
jgi:hypothetical protein